MEHAHSPRAPSDRPAGKAFFPTSETPSRSPRFFESPVIQCQEDPNRTGPEKEQEESAVDAVQRACVGCEREETPSVQTKLEINHAGDHFEQEADRVADQVADQLQGRATPTTVNAAPSQPTVTPLVMRQGQGSGTASPQVAQGIANTRGAGDSLSPPVRASMERAMGAHFGDVRVHTGSDADSLNRSLHSKAFTTGRDIYFRDGEYQPDNPAGQKLLAHELTHVLQQAASPAAVQRKIFIGGQYYIPKQDFDWIRKSYGEDMIEFLKTMHNDGNPPEYRFDDYKSMHYEIRVRSQAVKGMELTAKGCCSYPSAHPGGYLDDTFWDKHGSYHFTVKAPLPSGKNPSDAIEAVFRNGAGTELECNSMMTAVQYRSILQAIGATRFNARFPAGTGIVIRPVLATVSSAGLGPDAPNALKSENLYKRVSITSRADLLPGDWIYFRNIADYITKHPGGFWSGEHALYLGHGKFSGFGVTNVSHDECIKKLLDAYNNGLPESEKKKESDVPGIVMDVVRRPVVSSYVK